MGRGDRSGSSRSSSRKRSKGKRRRDSRSSSPDAAAAAARKAARYAALGKASKLRALLAKHPGLVSQALPDAARPGGPAAGTTLLHQACRHGHVDTVGLLLRRLADARAADSNGNTPGHLAAMHGAWLVLAELVQHAGAPPDLDAPNNAGLSIRQIVQLHKSGPGPQLPGSAGCDDDVDTDDARQPQQHADADADADAAGGGVDDPDAAWRARLAEERSDDEGGWGGLDGFRPPPAGRPAAPAAAAADGGGASWLGFDAGDDDDADQAWADRLWHDMQEHRRRTAQQAQQAQRGVAAGLGGAAAGRDAAATERQRRAAAAAAESARILREEQAKDADWRAAMMRQIEEAALPTKRSDYEARWQALEAWPAGRPIRFQDVPWPCATQPAVATAAAGPQPPQLQQRHAELRLEPQQLRTLLLAGARGPQDVKLALRREILRWHPDKFTAKFGSRLEAADRDGVLAGVHAVAQQLTALKQQ